VPLIQHKREAYWFYRFLSPLYDRWVNPLFWTAEMRSRALPLARLDRRELETVDVGAGTGFTTEGIVEHVDASRVTMVDQSPQQLARAARKPPLARCRRLLGDAEQLPLATDSVDRYLSAGSIEYWPQPQQGIAEAYRVLKAGGVALVIGPLPPPRGLARWLADAWMLFPKEAAYRRWFQSAGFEQVTSIHLTAPWDGVGRAPYALAIAGVKPKPGSSPLEPAGEHEQLSAPMGFGGRLRFAGRFLAGSAAGAAFVPAAAALKLRAKIRRRS